MMYNRQSQNLRGIQLTLFIPSLALAVGHLKKDGLGWNNWSDLTLLPESPSSSGDGAVLTMKAKIKEGSGKNLTCFFKPNIPLANHVTWLNS